MKLLKKCQVIVLLLANGIVLNACGNTNAENKTLGENNPVKQKTEATEKVEKANDSGVQTELDKAKKAGNAVFVVVTGTGAIDTDKATLVAKSANLLYKNSIVIQMDKDDASNAKLVAEWRLAGAPIPLILVISAKGLPTGGYVLSDATAENLAALIPSPKLEEVQTAISESKPVLVVFTKKTLTDRKEVLKVCKDAIAKLDNNAVIVEVDLDDSKETNFINQMRIDIASKASITLVINKQGQVAGTSTAVPDADKLVAAAKAPAKSGCGAGCGPAGCGK